MRAASGSATVPVSASMASDDGGVSRCMAFYGCASCGGMACSGGGGSARVCRGSRVTVCVFRVCVCLDGLCVCLCLRRSYPPPLLHSISVSLSLTLSVGFRLSVMSLMSVRRRSLRAMEAMEAM